MRLRDEGTAWIGLNNAPERVAPNGVFLPQWSRAIHAAHPKLGQYKKYAAGFADYMILRSGNRGDYGALIEVKFFVSLADEVLEYIFGEATADPRRGGAFNWDSNSDSVRLLKQVRITFCAQSRLLNSSSYGGKCFPLSPSGVP